MDFPCGNKWELHYSGSAIKKQEGGLPDLRIVNSTIGRHDVPIAAGRSLGAAVMRVMIETHEEFFSSVAALGSRRLVGRPRWRRRWREPCRVSVLFETCNTEFAVGSFDGEAAKVAAIIAGRLDAAKSAVRVKVVPTGSVLDSAKLFAAGKVDLAIVRADVGDLSQARSVALVNKSVLDARQRRPGQRQNHQDRFVTSATLRAWERSPTSARTMARSILPAANSFAESSTLSVGTILMRTADFAASSRPAMIAATLVASPSNDPTARLSITGFE